jgi:hypothetical protein
MPISQPTSHKLPINKMIHAIKLFLDLIARDQPIIPLMDAHIKKNSRDKEINLKSRIELGNKARAS